MWLMRLQRALGLWGEGQELPQEGAGRAITHCLSTWGSDIMLSCDIMTSLSGSRGGMLAAAPLCTSFFQEKEEDVQSYGLLLHNEGQAWRYLYDLLGIVPEQVLLRLHPTYSSGGGGFEKLLCTCRTLHPLYSVPLHIINI